MRVIALLMLSAQTNVNTLPHATAVVAPPTNTVTLGWNHSPYAGTVGYRIYYGGSSSVYTNSAIVGYTDVAAMTGLQWSTRYYFAVTAYDEDGNESVFSNEATALVVSPPPPTMGIRVYTLALNWRALAGVPYTLQWSTNYSTWSNYAVFQSGTNTDAVVVVTNDVPQKVWRVKL